MDSIIDLVKREPVRTVSAIQVTIAAAILFGLNVTEEQLSGVIIAISAWLGLVTRQQVTPVTKPKDD